MSDADGTTVPKKRTKRNYVDNETFTRELVEQIQRVKEAEANGSVIPPVNDYIARAFMNIAKGVGSRPNFAGYPYRDDMIMDGVENCLQYYKNFDPDKMKGKPNPHAYFTQIVWFAFLRRIKKEKKEQYIRFKSSQELMSLGETFDSDEIRIYLSNDVDYINNFIEDFETKMAEEQERSNAGMNENEKEEENADE